MGISGGLFAITIIAYLITRKLSNKSDIKQIKQLRQGTEKKYTSDVLYQKLLPLYSKMRKKIAKK